MGKWDEITLLIEVLTPLVSGDGVDMVLCRPPYRSKNGFRTSLKTMPNHYLRIWRLMPRAIYTPRKINMEPGTTPLEKENHLANHHEKIYDFILRVPLEDTPDPSQTVSMLIFRGVSTE